MTALDKIKKIDEILVSINETASKITLDETVINELKDYRIMTRDKKNLISKSGFQNASALCEIAHALELCQSYRDRVLDINTNLSLVYNDISELKKQADTYIFKNYGDIVNAYKTKEAREQAYDSITEEVCKKLNQCKKIRDISEMTMANLKDTHFALVAIAELAKEVYSSRRVKDINKI